jgi:hypothetical protein
MYFKRLINGLPIVMEGHKDSQVLNSLNEY